MPLEFGLLSMTELRNRPGEILNRVADNREAFIIERNGQRKACIVPLSVFFPDISPCRIADEFQELLEQGEEPRTSITEDRELVFFFAHKLADETSLVIRILLPHGYPNACPRVYIDPSTEGAPHRWADGALCLYGVMVGWNPGRHTVFYTLKLARRWVLHYEAWRQTGVWPKRESLDE